MWPWARTVCTCGHVFYPLFSNRTHPIFHRCVEIRRPFVTGCRTMQRTFENKIAFRNFPWDWLLLWRDRNGRLLRRRLRRKQHRLDDHWRRSLSLQHSAKLFLPIGRRSGPGCLRWLSGLTRWSRLCLAARSTGQFLQLALLLFLSFFLFVL